MGPLCLLDPVTVLRRQPADAPFLTLEQGELP
jgi:hypothetical protein